MMPGYGRCSGSRGPVWRVIEAVLGGPALEAPPAVRRSGAEPHSRTTAVAMKAATTEWHLHAGSRSGNDRHIIAVGSKAVPSISQTPS